jgi:hypothetical protein
MRTCGGIFVITITLSLVVGCKKDPTASARAPKTVAIVEPAPGAAGAHASGGAAISPPANGQITDEQVRSYVLAHRVPPAVEATNVAVVSTSFITSQEVSSLLHTARIALPDQAPMCLVVLSGRFSFRGPGGATATFPMAIEVFDARTGRLMQTGGLSSPPRIDRTPKTER